MFRKILIANRGEIACRIARTARGMGIATIAVHSDADAGALHVALADEAVHIGGPAPADSYLRGDAIIAAARATGAEAIHPGYGFLSENPDFVDAVTAAGLTFIGPSAAAIRAMGLKDAAKRLMQEAGVPVVPGYLGDDQSSDRLTAEAARIGYPVLIKAVAGGGGKGMRRVDNPADFATALASAQGEAQTAFGNPAVLIEKYVDSPRHIEMQVFGDGTDALHLYERDCSLQRRHQKVIEEAPAPGMTAEMRAAMGEAAVRAARAIGYSGAGTVEFIVDGSDGLRPDRFWFMEMNTRLQVEHPVTEAITGLDLVAWQIRIAAGERLPLRQDQIPLTGHAFEARLYAEDVAAGFLPATGTLTHLAFPDDIRADTGVTTGDTISPWYDPMIAKVIAHGPTRDIALARLARALDRTEVAGTRTNLAFLAALARQPDFARGKVDTGLIAREIDSLATTPPLPAPALARAAITLAGLDSGTDPLAGFTQWTPLAHDIAFAEGRVRLIVHGPRHLTARSDGTDHDCRLTRAGWQIDGADPGRALAHAAGLSVFGAATWTLTPLDPLARTSAALAGDGITRAPMPGVVKSVFVAPGDPVQPGDRLAVLEAMKMEHALTADRAGIVAELLTAPGDQVEAGAALIRLEDTDA